MLVSKIVATFCVGTVTVTGKFWVEPSTSETTFCTFMCILVCLLAWLSQLTITFKLAHLNVLRRLNESTCTLKLSQFSSVESKYYCQSAAFGSQKVCTVAELPSGKSYAKTMLINSRDSAHNLLSPYMYAAIVPALTDSRDSHKPC